MKQTLLFLFLSFSLNLVAQNANITLEMTVPESSATVVGDEVQVIGEGTIRNLSNEPVTVLWQRTVIELFDGWETAVCDKNLCYIPTIEEMELELDAGEESIFNVYIYPNGISGGAAIVELTATDISNTENRVSGVYSFNQTTTSTFSQRKPEIKIFPNPTTNYISVNDADIVESIIVYNIIGRPVKFFSANTGNQYNVTDLPTGMYLVRLVGENNTTLRTVRLSKRGGA